MRSRRMIEQEEKRRDGERERKWDREGEGIGNGLDETSKYWKERES